MSGLGNATDGGLFAWLLVLARPYMREDLCSTVVFKNIGARR